MRLVGIKEISEMIGVKSSTLYQWSELGQIPCIKLNGCLRFDLDEIMRWIKACKKGTDSSYNSPVQTRCPGKEAK